LLQVAVVVEMADKAAAAAAAVIAPHQVLR
jgi:hypothetical protein